MKYELKVGKAVKIISDKYEKNGKYKKGDICYVRDVCDRYYNFLFISHDRYINVVDNATIIDSNDVEIPEREEVILKTLREWKD